jgi:hypothetical protein
LIIIHYESLSSFCPALKLISTFTSSDANQEELDRIMLSHHGVNIDLDRQMSAIEEKLCNGTVTEIVLGEIDGAQSTTAMMMMLMMTMMRLLVLILIFDLLKHSYLLNSLNISTMKSCLSICPSVPIICRNCLRDKL